MSYQEQREHAEKASERERRRKYNLEPEDFNGLWITCGGRCCICEVQLKGVLDVRLHVDHCHHTGKVRGLLCLHCNTGIGQLKDSAQLLRVAAEYLDDTGAHIDQSM